MVRSKYSRGLKIKVAKEAMLPENQGLEHVIAEKYHVMPWTVIKWRDHLQQVGEENAFLSSLPLHHNRQHHQILFPGIFNAVGGTFLTDVASTSTQ